MKKLSIVIRDNKGDNKEKEKYQKVFRRIRSKKQ
jgi:hypothetical protein